MVIWILLEFVILPVLCKILSLESDAVPAVVVQASELARCFLDEETGILGVLGDVLRYDDWRNWKLGGDKLSGLEVGGYKLGNACVLALVSRPHVL